MIHVINTLQHPEYTSQAISYIQKRWAIPSTMKFYEDSISHSSSPLPQWYILYTDNEIIGCAGLITNDFISRMDLYPWICDLYVEEKFRGHNYSKLLIDTIKEDAKAAGYKNLYCATDHKRFFERFSFTLLGTGYRFKGDVSSIYVCKL
jgi:GNAT superfamily N-acetyltransferase